MASNEKDGDPHRDFSCFEISAPSKSFSCLWCPLLTTTVPACLPARQGWSSRTPRGVHILSRHQRKRQPSLHAAWDALSACLATTLIGRWQLVSRRLVWTRGSLQVSFMGFARDRSNIAALTYPRRKGSELQSWAIFILKFTKSLKFRKFLFNFNVEVEGRQFFKNQWLWGPWSIFKIAIPDPWNSFSDASYNELTGVLTTLYKICAQVLG
jgi:hypothetical protein